MKLSVSAILFLLPASILAADSSNEQCQVIALSAIRCKIVGVDAGSTANCRTGPGTDFPVAKKISADAEHLFSCYKKGTCVDNNCTWDQLHYDGGSCFLSGSLTDDRCTIAALGECEN
ncbi:hypothetical protein V495_01802 [Pseudogymnoascus sp. VKM F-4514 (FW-929)]|nr:hypothetical protein V490_09421 [Pseudogymnoascus sp. VKM F-3557]KFY47802.1 hypothetical protein V495_01802 [Pseudogymnoascus sp. VKM F-4514 (FW-929)]KFY62603.1 hypothetical protein V497_02288 [Pseudogymnoascus sp. VKM F-4516 (FW-969)]